jgi:AcrR family transcriptional regulator
MPFRPLWAGGRRETTLTSKTTRKTGAARPSPDAPSTRPAAGDPADMVVARTDRPRVASDRARQIYLEASRLFVAKGYDATSMSDIAEAVKITKPGLYHFVQSKEDLLFTIVSFGMDELFDEVVEPARQIADPLERLRLIIRNHLLNIGRVGSSSGNPVTIIADEPSGLGPEKRQIVSARKRVYFDLIRDTLRELQVRGQVSPDTDTTVATHSIIGTILWTARWRRPRGRLTIEQIVEQITDMLLYGVLKR